MAYYFLYKCPNGTKVANIPSSKNIVEVYYKMQGQDVSHYAMVYTGADPITLNTLRTDPDMTEYTEADYLAAKANPLFTKKVRQI